MKMPKNELEIEEFMKNMRREFLSNRSNSYVSFTFLNKSNECVEIGIDKYGWFYFKDGTRNRKIITKKEAMRLISINILEISML